MKVHEKSLPAPDQVIFAVEQVKHEPTFSSKFHFLCKIWIIFLTVPMTVAPIVLGALGKPTNYYY